MLDFGVTHGKNLLSFLLPFGIFAGSTRNPAIWQKSKIKSACIRACMQSSIFYQSTLALPLL
jgi:uncharacterized Tic20 family protein